LFQALVSDYGRLPTNQLCKDESLKERWNDVYGWDTHPWYVVLRSSQATASDLGHWRYRFYEVWSRCRLNELQARAKNPVLNNLAKAHQDLDELRRILTRQVQHFQQQAAPLVQRIRSILAETEGKLDQSARRMKRERKLIKYRLRRWGIHRVEPETCNIGF
jgi:DNA-binding NtrC family response regulator